MKLLDIYEKSDMFRCAKGGGLAIETASLFVSGIVLREIFLPQIAFEDCREGYSFEQVWFALCLYHDKRMESESRWKRACQERAEWETGQWESRNIGANDKWEPMHLCLSPLFQYSGEGMKFTNGAQVTGAAFSEGEIRDYFYFRSACSREGGMDHGIAGGLMLYESLVRRHLKQRGNLGREDLDLYSYAANTMMVHNILKGDKTMHRIIPKKDPMLFLLILADALEPLQYAAESADYRYLLKCVEAEVSEQKIRLRWNPECFVIEGLEENLRNMQKKIKLDYKIWRETAEIFITM